MIGRHTHDDAVFFMWVFFVCSIATMIAVFSAPEYCVYEETTYFGNSYCTVYASDYGTAIGWASVASFAFSMSVILFLKSISASAQQNNNHITEPDSEKEMLLKLQSQIEEITSGLKRKPKEVISAPSGDAPPPTSVAPMPRKIYPASEVITCPECDNESVEVKWSGKLRCSTCQHQWWNETSES